MTVKSVNSAIASDCDKPSRAELLSSVTIPVPAQTIIDFARQFDPQPYHLDPEAGANSIFGGLCASGWQVAAYATRLLGETLLQANIPFVDITSVEQMRWKRPTFVDDSIRVELQVLDRCTDSPIPECETLRIDARVLNQADADVAHLTAGVAVAKAQVL